MAFEVEPREETGWEVVRVERGRFDTLEEAKDYALLENQLDIYELQETLDDLNTNRREIMALTENEVREGYSSATAEN